MASCCNKCSWPCFEQSLPIWGEIVNGFLRGLALFWPCGGSTSQENVVRRNSFIFIIPNTCTRWFFLTATNSSEETTTHWHIPDVQSPPSLNSRRPLLGRRIQLRTSQCPLFNLLMLCRLLPVRFCLLLTIRQPLDRNGVSLCSVSAKFGTAS